MVVYLIECNHFRRNCNHQQDTLSRLGAYLAHKQISIAARQAWKHAVLSSGACSSQILSRQNLLRASILGFGVELELT
eukprot:4426705-Amphidinium_carterae.1